MILLITWTTPILIGNGAGGEGQLRIIGEEASWNRNLSCMLLTTPVLWSRG